MTEGRKDDTGKRRWQLLRKGCVHALEAVIKVLEYGAKKYGDENWKLVENAEVRYRDALDRHLASLDKGILYDEDTGEHQLAHVATNALFLLELHEAKKAGLAPRTEVPEESPEMKSLREVLEDRTAGRRWIKNLGTKPAAVLGRTAPIDVKFRNGDVYLRCDPRGFHWNLTGLPRDIIYWRCNA